MPSQGEVLNGRYELLSRIGGGSMGEVWRARDLVLGRVVAVKVVLPGLLDAPTFAERFAAEARVMAMIDHAGVVGVYDYGYTDPATGHDTAFLVMEYVEGESLDRVLARSGRLEPRFVLQVLASLLDALAAVHRAGVVHRDVKPANVMLTSAGVVLADFGIARSPESLGLTAADALMGTVPYLAPELFESGAATPAADVYAVGVLGYELVAGRKPFAAESTAAVMYQHLHEAPPPLPRYVPDAVVAVLERALEKDAPRRWPDAAAMAVAVRRALELETTSEYDDPLGETELVVSGGRHAARHASSTGELPRHASSLADRDSDPEPPVRRASSLADRDSDPEPSARRASSFADRDSDSEPAARRASSFVDRDPDPLARHAGSFADRDSDPEPSARRASTELVPLPRREAPPARPTPPRNRTLISIGAAVAAVFALVVAIVVNASGSPKAQTGGTGTAQQQAQYPAPGALSPTGVPLTPSASYPAYTPQRYHTSNSHTPSRSSGTPSHSATVTATAGPTSVPTAATATTPTAAGTTSDSSSPTTSASTHPSTATVPDVTADGNTYSDTQAESTLTNAGFAVNKQVDVPGPQGCHVTSQSPAANSSAAYGSTVTIHITCAHA